VSVADGRYKLTIELQTRQRDSDPDDPHEAEKSLFFDLLELDYSGMPAEVEVRGETVDLPPIWAYLK
jgi:hypothetical protein